MRFAVAFKKALQYHAVAFVPNLIGGGIAAVSLWIGVIDPALSALPGAAGGVQGLLEAALGAPYNLPVAVVGVVGGLLIRRIGKTALLFKVHGTAVVDAVDDELIEDQPGGDGAGGTGAGSTRPSGERAGDDAPEGAEAKAETEINTAEDGFGDAEPDDTETGPDAAADGAEPTDGETERGAETDR
jgi:hypothetical protein